MRSPLLKTTFVSLFFTTLYCLSVKAQPTVTFADPRGDYNSVKVIYSTAMDPVTTTSTGNYSLVNSGNSVAVPISSVTLSADQATVVVHLGASLQVTTNYTLVITGVHDISANDITPDPNTNSFYFGGPPGGLSFTFNDGQVPVGTFLATSATVLDGFNGGGGTTNIFEGITTNGGFNNTGCFILVSNTTGMTYAQWHNTNAYFLEGGQPVSSFEVKFKFWMVDLDPGFSLANNIVGNGLLFHVGPDVPQQYTGGASSYGNGLDLTFRNFGNGVIPQGVDLFWYPPYTETNTAPWYRNTDVPAGTIPNTAAFLTTAPFASYTTNWIHTNSSALVSAFVDTNGIGGGVTSFSNYVSVDFSVSNGVANVVCSNANLGSVLLFSNQVISGWTPIIGGSPGSGLPASFDFTATDGSGNHQMVAIDDVDLSVNGVHIPGSGITTNQLGPVQITSQPASVTNNEDVYVSFSVSTIGALPQTYQWYSNGVVIAGATSSSYRTPLTLFAMNGTAYSVVVSNDFSSMTSSNAILTIVKDTNGVQVASVGSTDGNSIGVQFSSFIDPTTAGNPANYIVNGGSVSVTAATVRTAFANFGDPVLNYENYQKTVRLSLGGTVSGSYTVTVKSGVLSRTGVAVVQTNLTGHVLGVADVDLGTPGTDPVAAGEAFSGGDNMLEIIASGSDMMAIAPTGTADHGNYGYVSRTGNFDIVAALTWETPTASGAKAGMVVRPSPSPTDGSSPSLSELVFPKPGRSLYETAVRASYGVACASWAAPGQPANGNTSALWPSPNWIRIRRVGPTFQGFYSGDGLAWTLLGSISTLDTNTFTPLEYIGLAATAGNNSGALNEADFSSFGAMNFAGSIVTINPNLRSGYTNFENARQTFSIGAAVTGGSALPSDLTYQWQRKGQFDSGFTDILDGTGNTNTYTTPILTQLNDDQSQYRAIVYVGDPGAGHSITSVVATLTVKVDVTPPYMTAASADSTFQTVWINFDGPLDYGSASTIANYIVKPVSGGSPLLIDIAQPILSADGISYTNVSLTIDSSTPILPGVKYWLYVSNVLDTANNNINSNTVPLGGGPFPRQFNGWALGIGYLTYERYTGPGYPAGAGPYTGLIDGPSTATSVGLINNPKFPNSPDVTQLITYSGYPNGDINNTSGNLFDFGARIRGFFIPPNSPTNYAYYQWYVRGNDGTALWVSTSSTPPNAPTDHSKACDNEGFSTARSWVYSITNISANSVNGTLFDTTPIPMTNGQMYGLVALEQQGNGTSDLEFTWGYAGGSTVYGGDSITNNAGSAYPVGTTPPARGGAPTNSYNLTGTNIATWVNPDLSKITATSPTNIIVESYQSGSFSVSASAALSGVPSTSGLAPTVLPVNYQWYSNNVAIAGATNAAYTTPMVVWPGVDQVVTYSVVMSVGSLNFMTITNSATETIVRDTSLPTVVSAGSFGGNMIGLRFSELVNATTATTLANYTGITGGASVLSARLASDGITVMLTLNQALSPGSFSVQVSGVQDLSGNVITTTNVTGSVVGSTLSAVDIGVGTNTLGSYVVQTNNTLTNVTFDINFPAFVSSVTSGVFEVTASGQGFGTNNTFSGSLINQSYQDGFNYIFEPRNGDFDVKARVERIDTTDARSGAGLMARAGLDPGALQFMIEVGPPAVAATDGSGTGYNGVTLLRRQTNSDVVTVLGNNPNPPVLGSAGAGTNQAPIWLRMRRMGSSFYFYTGADGTNWMLCGRATGQTQWPVATYVGMATASASKSSYTQSRFSQYGNYIAPAQPEVLFLGMANNVTGASPIDNPAGNPNGALKWLTADSGVYNLLVSRGYTVTIEAAGTARIEDGTGMSLIFWCGTSSSSDFPASTGGAGGGNGGNPNGFTWMPVPVIQAKDATLPKEGWVYSASDEGHAGGQTLLKIINTNNPIIKGFYSSNQVVQVQNTSQYFSFAKTNSGSAGLAPGFTAVAVNPTNSQLVSVYYADKASSGLANTGIFGTTNFIAHRRVGLWLGDNGGNPAGDFTDRTSDGDRLLQNAISWAIATNEVPYITNQPVNKAVTVGSVASFSVGAWGPGPYSYQWLKISGGTTNPVGGSYADYYTPATTLADSGTQFQVIVTALYGSVTSSVVTLTVQNGLVITNQPVSQTNSVGGTITFTVGASGSSPGYQWYSNNVAVANANSSNYTTVPLTLANNGDVYKVVVTNLVSSVTSSNAVVTVVAGGQPIITSFSRIDATHLSINWTNGTGNSVLLSSTNVTVPVTNWTPVVTNPALPYTITAQTNVPELFYRVKQ